VEALAYRLAQGEPLDTAANPWFEEKEQDREVEELRAELEQARAEVLRVNGENEGLRRQVRRMECEQAEVAETMMETSRLIDELFE
jgi:predicted  nucleic acid-binding Zn-ribbon protein